MIEISDDEYEAMIADALERLPKTHMKSLKNVAIVYADDPTPEQRRELKLQCYQSLYGLYEGVPLTRRNGITGFPPDKITLFKNPMLEACNSLADLKEQIRHTLWHEVAHYFGLNHEQIHSLE
jgi:predicted Zn-dependent protease with MMP-like domain